MDCSCTAFVFPFLGGLNVIRNITGFDTEFRGIITMVVHFIKSVLLCDKYREDKKTALEGTQQKMLVAVTMIS